MISLNLIFDVGGINFMRSFSSSFGNEYILLTVNYVSKWVKVMPTRTTEARGVVKGWHTQGHQ